MPKNNSFNLSNPDKIFYPEKNITKKDIAEYYFSIQEWILPYVIKRPLSLYRCPNGYNNECFYQKNFTHDIEKPLYPIKIKDNHFIYIKDTHGLIELVQLGVLEIHPWGSRVDNIEKPDMIIFDLDPGPQVEWKQVVAAAHFIREQLQQLSLISFVKTTGGKGLHIVVPIKRLYNWDKIKLFTQTFVEYLVSLKPNEFVGQMTKSKRPGKIFIDYLRNARGATAVAAYSTRARSGAPVSTPLAWDELSPKIQSNFYTIENLPKRLVKLTEDPWEGFCEVKQSLPHL